MLTERQQLLLRQYERMRKYHERIHAMRGMGIHRRAESRVIDPIAPGGPEAGKLPARFLFRRWVGFRRPGEPPPPPRPA